MSRDDAELDHVAEGRTILSLGCGWHQPEFDAVGIGFDKVVDTFEEALRIVVPVSRGESGVTFDGAHYRTKDAELRPRPWRPDMPVLIAAFRPRMLRPHRHLRRRLEHGLDRRRGRLHRAGGGAPGDLQGLEKRRLRPCHRQPGRGRPRLHRHPRPRRQARPVARGTPSIHRSVRGGGPKGRSSASAQERLRGLSPGGQPQATATGDVIEPRPSGSKSIVIGEPNRGPLTERRAVRTTRGQSALPDDRARSIEQRRPRTRAR